jgi:hypothetical protein
MKEAEIVATICCPYRSSAGCDAGTVHLPPSTTQAETRGRMALLSMALMSLASRIWVVRGIL